MVVVGSWTGLEVVIPFSRWMRSSAWVLAGGVAEGRWWWSVAVMSKQEREVNTYPPSRALHEVDGWSWRAGLALELVVLGAGDGPGGVRACGCRKVPARFKIQPAGGQGKAGVVTGRRQCNCLIGPGGTVSVRGRAQLLRGESERRGRGAARRAGGRS